MLRIVNMYTAERIRDVKTPDYNNEEHVTATSDSTPSMPPQADHNPTSYEDFVCLALQRNNKDECVH